MSCGWYEFGWPSSEGHIVKMAPNTRLRCLVPIVIISFRFGRPCTDVFAVIVRSPRLVVLYGALLGVYT